MMWVERVRFVLPESFRRRYALGRVVWLLPALTAVVAFLAAKSSLLLPWILLKYVAVLGVISWLALKRSSDLAWRIERDVRSDYHLARALYRWDWKYEVLPPLAAAVIVAVSNALAGSRPFIVAAAFVLGGLLLLGLVLRWLVYDRWLEKQLAALDPHNRASP